MTDPDEPEPIDFAIAAVLILTLCVVAITGHVIHPPDWAVVEGVRDVAP